MTDFYRGKNVVVIGASGLTGHALVEKLVGFGANVRATIHTQRQLRLANDILKQIEIRPCELMDYDDCRSIVKDMDVAMFVAAFLRGAKGQTETPHILVRRNLIPAINCMEAACLEGVDRFGFIGSSTMYPPVTYPVAEEEGFQADPDKLYMGVGWMKRYCEKFAMHFHDLFKTNFALIRSTAIYGPHDTFDPEVSHVLPALIVRAAKRETPFLVWGTGKDVRDFVHVSDVADGLLMTVEKHACADPINIATGVAHTIKDAVQIIMNHLNHHAELVFDESKPSMIPIRLVSVEKAKSVLNFEAKYSLEDGLRDTIDWYVRQQAA